MRRTGPKKLKVVYEGCTDALGETLTTGEVLDHVLSAVIGDDGIDLPVLRDSRGRDYTVQYEFKFVPISRKRSRELSDILEVCNRHWEDDCEECRASS